MGDLLAGGHANVLKQTSMADLLASVCEARNGRQLFSPALAMRILRHCQQVHLRGDSTPRRADRLTPREVEVLRFIAEGNGNKQIAAELHISIKTVEKHRQQVMNKLGIHTVAGLTCYAIIVGMIECIFR